MNRQKLQRLIDRCAAAYNAAHEAATALNEECERLYGRAPADIDVDYIIDGVYGGCGLSEGMDARDFHETMLQAIGEASPDGQR